MKNSLKKTGLRLFFFLLASSLLFLGFYRNQWNTTRPKKFSLFQKDVEAYVIGRLVWSRQHGILSSGGLLGWGDVDPANDISEKEYQHQYDTYLKDLSFKSFLAKESHPGFQGIFFSTLDRISPFPSSDNLRLFRMLTAGVFAIILGGVIFWFVLETGWLPAVFVFGSILTSQWMTLFGRNLFFVSGLFYLPILLLLFRLRRERSGSLLSQSGLFLLVFFSILLKCLFNGFDFILPTLVMVASPLIFYAVKDRWNRRTFVTRFLNTVLAALAAILASLVVLSIQVMFASGSFSQGMNYILETISRRTLGGDPDLPLIYLEARNASMWSILKIYFSSSYFYSIGIPYFAIATVFAIISAAQVWLEKMKPSREIPSSLGLALIAATWFSLLGPLGWYIIFKSVAYFHTHMNYLPWHMPFTLFGFALCGFFVHTLFSTFKPQNRKSMPPEQQVESPQNSP